jgi:glycosyltransferase involved in cell wall biosynthesis
LRVLALSNRLPWPLDDGWNVRTFHVLRGLAGVADVTLLSLGGAPADRALADALPGVRIRTVGTPDLSRPLRLAAGFVTGSPLPVWNQRSAGLRTAIGEELARSTPDVCLSVTTFFLDHFDLLPSSTPIVIDTHNIDSLNFARYAERGGLTPKGIYARRTARLLRRVEREAFARAAGVWVCSAEDRAAAHLLCPSARVDVVPNGVDASAFRVPRTRPDRPTFLFFGRLDYYPNIDGVQWLLDEVLPLLRARFDDFTIRIVGSGDLRAVRRLVGDRANVEMIGRVPDIRTELGSATACLVPLRVGGGTRLKIVEALATTCPVVSTRVGAEGIDVRDGHDILLADSPSAFADAAGRLAEDSALAERIGQAGAQCANNRYDWQSIERQMQDLLAECVAVHA